MVHNLLVNSPCLVTQTAECVFVFPSLSPIDKPTGRFGFFAALSPLHGKGDSAAKKQGSALKVQSDVIRRWLTMGIKTLLTFQGPRILSQRKLREAKLSIEMRKRAKKNKGVSEEVKLLVYLTLKGLRYTSKY